MLQVLVTISQSFVVEKKAWGYSKVIPKIKEEEKKKKELRKKWTNVRDIENNGYSDARLKKRRKQVR